MRKNRRLLARLCLGSVLAVALGGAGATAAWADGGGLIDNGVVVDTPRVASGAVNQVKFEAWGYFGTGSTATLSVYKLSDKTDNDALNELGETFQCDSGTKVYSSTIAVKKQGGNKVTTYTSPSFGSAFTTGTYGVVVRYKGVDVAGDAASGQYAQAPFDGGCLGSKSGYYFVGVNSSDYGASEAASASAAASASPKAVQASAWTISAAVTAPNGWSSIDDSSVASDIAIPSSELGPDDDDCNYDAVESCVASATASAKSKAKASASGNLANTGASSLTIGVAGLLMVVGLGAVYVSGRSRRRG